MRKKRIKKNHENTYASRKLVEYYKVVDPFWEVRESFHKLNVIILVKHL